MSAPNKEKRLIHVYTGDGKGKTTTAMGLALRACGQGWNVLMIQFMKGREGCGEVNICKSIPNFELIRYGLPDWVKPEAPTDDDKKMAGEAFQKASDAIFTGRYDMVILDELNVAVDFELLPLGDVVSLLKNKPDSVELVLTGRRAHPDLVAMADYVSEIREVKHPFREKIRAREGVDY